MSKIARFIFKNWITVLPILAIVFTIPLIVFTTLKIFSIWTFIAVVVAILGLLLNLSFHFYSKEWSEVFDNALIDNSILYAVIKGNIEELKELDFKGDEQQLLGKTDDCLIAWASFFNNLPVLEYLIQKNLKIESAFKKNFSAATIAARMGHFEIYKTLKDNHLVNVNHLSNEKVSLFMLNCFEGNIEEVMSNGKFILAQQKDNFNLTALHYALLGNVKPEIIRELIKYKANINVVSSKIKFVASNNEFIIQKELNPIFMAFEILDEDLLIELLVNETEYSVNSSGVTVLMKSVEKDYLKLTELLAGRVDLVAKDNEGNDVINYTRAFKRPAHEAIIRKQIEIFIEKNSPQSLNEVGVNNKITTSKKGELDFNTIKEMLQQTLYGMVNIETFIDNFSEEIRLFSKGNSARGIILWGNSAVGKSEIAKRLTGTFKSNIIPFELPDIEILYVTCTDQANDIKKITENVNGKAIVFLDEVDKFLSVDYGMVSESEAKRFRGILLTNFDTKQILWVYTGSFLDIRGNNNLNSENLKNMMGLELSTRLDFADFKLNDWTFESLLKAAKPFLRRDEKIDYDDEALVQLVNHILKSNSGVRGLEKAHDSIKRSNRGEIDANGIFKITSAHINKLIEKEGSV